MLRDLAYKVTVSLFMLKRNESIEFILVLMPEHCED